MDRLEFDACNFLHSFSFPEHNRKRVILCSWFKRGKERVVKSHKYGIHSDVTIASRTGLIKRGLRSKYDSGSNYRWERLKTRATQMHGRPNDNLKIHSKSISVKTLQSWRAWLANGKGDSPEALYVGLPGLAHLLFYASFPTSVVDDVVVVLS